MSAITKEEKAAKRRERRRLRRGQKKMDIAVPKPLASDTYPMVYEDPKKERTYQEGAQSNGCASVVERDVKSGQESKFLNITCYGKRNKDPSKPRDFSAEYFVPMDKFSQLGRSKKVTSVDVLNFGGEKKGTLTHSSSGYALLVQNGKMFIFGELNSGDLKEAIHEKLSCGFGILIREMAEEPQHTHEWEIKKVVCSPIQAEPTNVCTCTKCGVKFVTNAKEFTLPTRGCSVPSES